MRYDGKKVLILGYGKSGKACEFFLKERGADVTVYDDYQTEYSHGNGIDGYDLAIVSPGVSSRHKMMGLLKKRHIEPISELDLAYMNCRSKKILAVSGTNGKTTVCTILYDMLRRVGGASLVGNIGVPFISEAERIRRNDVVIVEVSSFQIEQSKVFRPLIAALTNVGEDHLDRHLTKERYRAIKLSLFDRAEIAVANGDDPNQSRIEKAISYAIKNENADYRLCGRDLITKKGKTKLPPFSRGAAYDVDYLCAYAVASTVAGERKCFVESYSAVKLPRFRNEYVGELSGGAVYNDSKGTNIDATLFAISKIEKNMALILGGSDKGEDYARLMAGLGERVVKVYLVGANAGDMYRAAAPEVRKKCMPMADLESCVADFAKTPCPVLLFSPASASFDLYSGYQERGEKFNEILKRYGTVFAESE